MNIPLGVAFFAIGALAATLPAAAQSGDAARGERVFRACTPCHSLAPNRHMTGPSLAEVWNRKAAGVAGFARYSPALKGSGIVWDDASLDAWLQNPAHFIPGNTMIFRGVADARQRADLIAFLKEATKPGAPQATMQAPRQGGGMMGMMGSGQSPNLKTLDPEDRVQSISYCADTYRVTTADGKTHQIWERNLRFKTDAGEDGPRKNTPALVGAGMVGDRANVIFADPDEISSFIRHRC